MPLLYRYSPDELPAQSTPLQIDEDSDSWWSGSQKSFAWIALAATMAVTATSTLIAAQVTRDVEEIPANTLRANPEEWYWQNPVAPRPQVIYQRLPLGDFDDCPCVAPPEEDFWRNPVAPIPASLYLRLPLGDPEEISANTLHGQPDEDFWINPVAPIPLSFFQRLPIGDPEKLPGNLHNLGDEDFWVSGVAPQTLSIWQRLPLGDPEEIPANTLKGQPDEDYWTPRIPPQLRPLAWPQPFGFDQSEITQQPTQIAEEDYWQNRVAPIAAQIYQRLPYAPDPEEIPAHTLSTIEETEWLRFIGLLFQFTYPQPWSFENQEFASFPYEEDVWQPRQSSAPWRSQTFTADDDLPVSTARATDEDYWFRQSSFVILPNFLPAFSQSDLEEASFLATKFVIWIGEDIA